MLGTAPTHAANAPAAPQILILDYTEARTRTAVSADPDRPKPGAWTSSAAVARSAVPDSHWCRGALLPNMGCALCVPAIHPGIEACPPWGGDGSVRFLPLGPLLFRPPTGGPDPSAGLLTASPGAKFGDGAVSVPSVSAARGATGPATVGFCGPGNVEDPCLRTGKLAGDSRTAQVRKT